MSEAAPQEPPLSRKGILFGALALGSPAVLWVLVTTCISQADSISLAVGLACPMLFCLATAAAYVRLCKSYPGTAPHFMALRAFFLERTDSRWARACNAVAGTASRICCWVLPGFWLAIGSAVAAMMIREAWPAVFSLDSPLVNLLPTGVFAVGLYFGRGRGSKVAIGVSFAIALMQIPVALVAFTALFARLDPPPKQSVAPIDNVAAWAIDSDGLASPWVQDVAPDPARTIPDPDDPTRQIQDPSATIPKVDPGGNPIWVYDAVDAQGKVLVDARGMTVVVPTDASGKLGALPAGAVKATPERVVAAPVSVQWLPPPAPTPIEARYAIAAGCMASVVLAGFQFLASLGQRYRGKSILLAGAIFTLLAQGALCALLRSDEARGYGLLGPLPTSDLLQIFGARCFHSATAGWWFMMTEHAIVLLLLIAATQSSFDAGAALHLDDAPAPRVVRTGPAKRFRALHTWARIGVAFLVCSLGLLQTEARSSPTSTLPGGATLFWAGGDLGQTVAVRLPELLTIIEQSSAWAVILLCVLVCLATAQALNAGRRLNRMIYGGVAAIGVLSGIACLAFFLAGPLFLARVSGKETLCAVGVCAAFGIGGAIRRRRMQRLQGHCPVCGYDLCATPDRCPECGVVSEEQTPGHQGRSHQATSAVSGS